MRQAELRLLLMIVIIIIIFILITKKKLLKANETMPHYTEQVLYYRK